MDLQQQQFLQMTCLINEGAEKLTKRILSSPNDVSHEFYKKIFKDFDWDAYEREKAKSEVSDNSDS